jgi:hypothetical protein
VYIVFIAMLSVAVAADNNELDEKKMHQNDLLEKRVIKIDL